MPTADSPNVGTYISTHTIHGIYIISLSLSLSRPGLMRVALHFWWATARKREEKKWLENSGRMKEKGYIVEEDDDDEHDEEGRLGKMWKFLYKKQQVVGPETHRHRYFICLAFFIYKYIHTDTCVCVCVCVFLIRRYINRNRPRDPGRKRKFSRKINDI